MKYLAYIDLNLKIKEFGNMLSRNVVFCMAIFFFYSFFVYTAKTQIPFGFFLTSEFICIGGLGFLLYNLTVPNSNLINKTALELVFAEEYVILKTSPVNVFFWINKRAKELKFNNNELKIRKTTYPIKQINSSDGVVFKITDREKEAYVIVEYFDSKLIGKLNDMQE